MAVRPFLWSVSSARVRPRKRAWPLFRTLTDFPLCQPLERPTLAEAEADAEAVALPVTVAALALATIDPASGKRRSVEVKNEVRR